MDPQLASKLDQSMSKIREMWLPAKLSPDSQLQLVITIEEEDINVRELASYFTFVDKIYGRLTPNGLASYAQRPEEQLEITAVRKGSIDVVISEIFSNVDKASPLIVLLIALKYLPDLFRAVGETVKNLAEAELKKVETEKLAREIKEQEERLTDLDDETLYALILVIISLYQRESRSLPAAYRFSEKHIKNIILHVGPSGNSN